jgi:hypothetical protein
MAKKASSGPIGVTDALLNAFAINDQISQYMIENLPPEVGRAEPPKGKGRGVAAIGAHRGQMAMLAWQAGHALPQKSMLGMWEWGTR